MIFAAMASMATESALARMTFFAFGTMVLGPAPSPHTVPSITEKIPGWSSFCMMSGMAVGFHCGEVNDILPEKHLRDLYPFRKNLVQFQQFILKGVLDPFGLVERGKIDPILLEDGCPLVVFCPLHRVCDHSLVLHSDQFFLCVSVLEKSLNQTVQLPGLAGARGKVLGPG
jgi:hypothetical protein